MDDDIVAAYLRRIGVERPAAADAAALRVLHRAHQVAVPFETMSRLRAHLLVAADVPGLPLHPRHHLLAAH